MKNLTRKLFLSICTLAICAVTLVSTTFAWYTTNTKVGATGLNATATATGASSILISKSADGDFMQDIVYTSEDGLRTDAMVPLQAVLTGENIELTECTLPTTAGSTTVTKGNTADEDSGKFFTITVHVKTTDLADDAGNVNVYLKSLTISNPNALTPWDNLLRGKTGDVSTLGINPNKATYDVDIVDALSMTTYWTTTGGISTKNPYVYDLAGVVTSKDVKTGENIDEASNALTYYNKVMGTNIPLPEQDFVKNLAKTNGSITGNELIVGVLSPENQQISITINIFLDGWDEYCFDACKGQTFNVSFAFTTEAKEAMTAA